MRNTFTNYFAPDTLPVIIDSIVILFLVAIIWYNWTLIKKLRHKIVQTYQEARLEELNGKSEKPINSS